MTKSIFSALTFLTLGAIAQSPFNFSINGTLKNTKENSKIYIHHKWNETTITDSVKVKGGKFSLLVNQKIPLQKYYFLQP